jgi:NAD-dependent SIR2 family protein deacetylase
MSELRRIDEALERAAQAIRDADALLISGGAGMGVDSGLPDFRGTEGFWRAYPVVAKLGLSFEQMANPAWFQNDPQLAWAFYGHRLNLYRRTKPHSGFDRLLEVGSRKAQGYWVFTSNVDGHFQKAGFAPERIVECHGSIHHLQCTRPCCREIWDADGETVAIDEVTFRALNPLPQCRYCAAVARPNILMFGDWSWHYQRTRVQQRGFTQWVETLEQSCAKLVAIELGAGSAIPTVRHTSEQVTERMGGTLIRINPREAGVPHGHIGLALGALDGVQKLVAPLAAL